MTEQSVVTKVQRPAPQAVRGQTTSTPITLTPKEILGIVRRHVLLIVICTIAGGIVAGCAWALLRMYNPKYTAFAYIEVLSPGKSDPLNWNAQIAGKDILYQSRLSKALLMRQQSSLEDLLRSDVIKETEWFKNFDTIPAAIDDLKNNLDVSAQRDAEFVQVGMTCRNPKESALIVNTMVDLFIKGQQTSTDYDIGDQLAKLRDQETTVREELKNIETSLDELRSVAGVSGITMIANNDDPSRNVITSKLNDLSIERDRLQANIKQIEANIGTLADLAKGPISVQTENQVEGDPIMLNLGERQSLLQAELARKLARFGENHREVRQMRESLKQTQEERNLRSVTISEIKRQANWKDAQDQLVFLKSRLTELERMRQEAEAKQKDLDSMRAKYESLVVKRDERQEMLTSIKQQIEKTNMMRTDSAASKVRAKSKAPVPLEISSPRALYYLTGGPFLGFLLGLALAFLIELLNDVVRTPSDIARYLRVSLLGMIPNAAEDDQVDNVELWHVVRLAPYSIVSECYRRLRTSMRLNNSAESLKTILVTSGSQSEGKTSTAVNLAATFIAEDKKVLFIDTNFRRPSSSQIFPMSSSVIAGHELSAVLTGTCNVLDAVRPSGIENLDVIDCGGTPFNPTELLASARMKDMIAELKNRYDHIILDSAPLLLVSDAKVLASIADSTIVVFSAASTKRGAAMRTLRELQESNANVVGCVLFGVKALKGGYFHEMFAAYRQYQKTELAHSI